MKATQTFELKGMKRSLVKPFYKTEHPKRLKPALWDLLYLDSYVPVIFFYRPPTDGSAAANSSSTSSTSLKVSERVAHLKDSLSKVLVHHYPFAGRWIKTYDETVRTLLCNDEGVPFFEAQIDEEMDTVIGNVDDFRAVPALGNFNLVGLDNLWFQQDVDFPTPPIFFQATGFKCGGISLYGGFSHQATDGKGFFDFMAAWSEQAMNDKLAVTPVHDHSLTVSLADFMGWMNGSSDAAEVKAEPEVQGHTNGVVAVESYGESSQPYGPEIESNGDISLAPNGTGAKSGNHSSNGEAGRVTGKTDPGAAMRLPLQIPLSQKTLLVRKEAIQELKREAIVGNSNDYVTTVDCITSHLWRCLNSLEAEPEEFHQSRTRSRPVQEGNPVECVLSTAVDARKRCHDPALPDQYIRNCLFVFQTPRLAPAELLSKSHLQAARIFHKTVREINPATWKDFLKATMLILADFGNCEFRHVLLSSWISFPMYDVEFQAGLGKPFFVGVNMESGFLPEGYCIFLPPRPGSPAAASIQFGLQDDVLRALLSHKSFLSFFH